MTDPTECCAGLDVSTEPPADLPTWLRPVAQGAHTITGTDLTAFAPPADAEPRAAAVLMLFGEGPDGPDLLLTERSHTMRSHPGQVSFPGGRLEPGETPAEAALREAWEETGLDRSGVEVFGRLPKLWLPPSNQTVDTILGWWREDSPVTTKSVEEVHAIYRVPIAELVDPAHRVRVRLPRNDWIAPAIMIGPDKDVILWGFTGGIVTKFLAHLGWLHDVPDAPIVELPEYMFNGAERPRSNPAE